jgi:flagellar hook-basal body complex protein FliE
MEPISAMRVALAQAGQAGLPAELNPRVARAIPAPELQPLPILSPAADTTRNPAPATFDQVLGKMVGEVNLRQAAAADKVQGLLSGQDVALHETMISIEEASLSFQLMVEVRNKLLESYQELMRMQV